MYFAESVYKVSKGHALFQVVHVAQIKDHFKANK